ncbi:Protein of unknown function DUF2148 [Desulfarculus baarsii DSM 2075]|uniref:DUF2148 domain-containing protein n=1 Tax=Desulfarculus baarsii (strain ATCC 33931 / DSM 2075 / LMG 7858 / VKM B-1802 / 2st14) TaxID=644282 RepID=E1QLW3_DESB2|nr:DUF2148 domain-containing protein [Desulfarculus baarsii]ADK86548.1 Protein of unknown function DUF2148 [Desulfarculus baarsii DSM 2075]
MSKQRSIKQFEEDRAAAARIAARLLLASGTTSPRVGGVGECTIHIVDDECDIEDLCQAVEDMADDNKAWKFFRRDAAMLRDADAVLLITSLRCLDDPADINCNMCGKITCDYLREAERLAPAPEVAFTGPLCVFRANNIAYALDGVISQARNLGVDYGVFWSAGAAAMRLGILPKATGFALAVAISVTEKSPFRDIPKRYDEINERTMNDRTIQRLWPQFRSIYS